jgi:sn-glycerol 3-phosphate transport system ATP-binding protein
MRAEIKRLQRRLGVTSLFVTHDQVEAMTLGDRLVVMHEGRAAQIASPMEIFERPADTYVAGFIGSPSMNFLPATITEDGKAARLSDGTIIALPEGQFATRPGQKVTLGIRPEHISLPGPLRLTTDLIEPLGSESVVHGKLASGETMALRLPGAPPSAAVLEIAPRTEHLHVFDAETGKRLPAPS